MNYSTRDGVHAPHVVRVSVTVSVCALLLVLQVQRESEYTCTGLLASLLAQ